jgi:hypothetical protein
VTAALLPAAAVVEADADAFPVAPVAWGKFGKPLF